MAYLYQLSSYKRRTLCYLLSHVTACGLPLFKMSVLGSLAKVSSTLKSKMLVSAVQNLSDEKLATSASTRFGNIYEEYSLLVASSFDTSASEGLNEPEGDIWAAYTQLLRSFFRSGKVSLPTP